MPSWIDFKELRQRLDFKAVLEHYRVEPKLKANGTQHHGYCPLPNHNGKKNSPSFSANLEKGVFQCFGCGAHGNLLEFAVHMEGLDPKNGADFRKVALKLQEMFFPDATRETRAANRPKQETGEKREVASRPEQVRVEVNAPLDFELKGLDASHPYLLGRGFSSVTIQEFGLGFCSRGSLKGRIAIPLHNVDGKLVGYAGRVVDDAAIAEENPKYKFPSKRNLDGVSHQFQKSQLVYNLHRLPRLLQELVVVEGFSSTWWLAQAGHKNAVALMGASCSTEQARLIVEWTAPAARIWIVPDADEAGARCAESLLMKVAPYRFIRWVKLDAAKQPTDYRGEELTKLLTPGGGA